MDESPIASQKAQMEGVVRAQLPSGLYEVDVDGHRITARESLLAQRYGRLRDVLVAPNGDVYVATSNRDGRGSPAPEDDRILRIAPKR